MTLKGGSTPSCAACKCRRRKCTPNCPLAPYFPANQPRMFRNVHRLFGVSHVTKLLEGLDTKDLKDDAMKSIIYEAEMRDRIPVYGCPFIISQLHSQLQYASEELRLTNLQIAACKERQSNQQVDHTSCHWPPSRQEFGGTSSSVDSQRMEDIGLVPRQFFLYEDGGNYDDSLANLAWPLPNFNSYNNLLFTHLQAQTSVFGIQEEPEIFIQDHEGIHYNTTADDTQSYIESKEE